MQMKNVSTRVAYLSILIFGFLIYNYYSAGVVSARLNEPIFKVNDSLNQLSNLPLKLSSEFMPYLEFVMKVKKNTFTSMAMCKFDEINMDFLYYRDLTGRQKLLIRSDGNQYQKPIVLCYRKRQCNWFGLASMLTIRIQKLRIHLLIVITIIERFVSLQRCMCCDHLLRLLL